MVFEINEKQDISIEVFDIKGKLVFSGQAGKISGTYTRILDLSKCNPGIYHLQVTTGRGIWNKKIIIE